MRRTRRTRVAARRGRHRELGLAALCSVLSELRLSPTPLLARGVLRRAAVLTFSSEPRARAGGRGRRGHGGEASMGRPGPPGVPDLGRSCRRAAALASGSPARRSAAGEEGAVIWLFLRISAPGRFPRDPGLYQNCVALLLPRRPAAGRRLPFGVASLAAGH